MPEDDLACLALQLEWGADEALDALPLDRLAAPPDVAAAPPGGIAREEGAPARRARPPLAPPSAAPMGGAARAEALARAAGDLDALRAALAGFEGSALRHTAENLVFGDGEARRGLVVVAEAPGADDDAEARPLSGAVGAYFDAMLGSIGVARAEVRVVCLVPWRPPGDRPPSAAEIAMLKPFLEAQLRLLGATHHLLLGGTVATALTEARGATRRLRGSVLPLRVDALAAGAVGLVMTPPAQAMREPALRRDVWRDLLTLREMLDAAAASRFRDPPR